MMPSPLRSSDEKASPLAMAARGDAHRVRGAVDRHPPAGGAVGAEQQARQLRSARIRAARPGRPPRRGARRGRSGCSRACGRCPRALSTGSSRSDGAGLAAAVVADLLQQVQLVAEHRRDQLTRSSCAGRVLADQTAVAQHRHSIGDLVHLVEEVRDEQNRGAAVAQPAHHPEQFGDLVGVEARRRLVEDQHARRDRGGPRDGDELLNGDGVRAEGGAGVDGQVELAQEFRGAAIHRAVVDPAEADGARDPAGCSLPQ